MDQYAIIVAGGSGKRMGGNTPKQFIEVGGLPILCHTINAFYQSKGITEIIVVLPGEQLSFWQELCNQFGFHVKHTIVKGGKSRFESVKNGLKAIKNLESLVAIHDGVRPFIHPEIIEKSFRAAEKFSSGVVATKPKESIRRQVGNKTVSENRAFFFSIQTPQTFQTKEIMEAYQREEKIIFTDDASVAEDFGIAINLVEGSDENIKITTQTDLIFASALFHRQKQKK